MRLNQKTRRKAYEQAMAKTRGRPLGLGLTDEQIRAAIAAESAYEGNVFCGDTTKFQLPKPRLAE